MVNAPTFDTVDKVQAWGAELQLQKTPDVCIRCYESEKINNTSIRLNAIDRHKILKKIREDYLIIGGTIDNYCNSACLTCSPHLSTKISKLLETNTVNNNYHFYKQLPHDRIIELDINGGEPTYSKNYRHLLDNLPQNVKIIRINTNGSKYFSKVEELLQRNIKVIITLSLDGTEEVHNFVRWPIKWETYKATIEKYLNLKDCYSNLSLDFWTTLSALNLKDFQNILNYANLCGIPHQYGLLKTPDVLNIKYKNSFTNCDVVNELTTVVGTDIDNNKEINEFVMKQAQIRGIKWQL